jgi:hypothetical protein
MDQAALLNFDLWVHGLTWGAPMSPLRSMDMKRSSARLQVNARRANHQKSVQPCSEKFLA